MLRIATAGNVDDGKSTLIGRLFHDSKALLEDQLDELRAQARKRGSIDSQALDLAAFTDGLKAEREQGITIDVAYRYFATSRRSFILADSPGHAQYTRNMVTGASTADCAIILIDARHGVTTQTRRHAYLASLLGIRHLAVAVNKMDLLGFEQARFDAIIATFRAFASEFPDKNLEIAAFPISALDGDNIVSKSERTPWYQGPPLLSWLESLPSSSEQANAPLRLPVQTVIHPNQSFRGFAGQIGSGRLRVGDTIEILPARKTTQVARIVTFDGDLVEATAGQSVTLTLTDEVDIGRGDLIVHHGKTPKLADHFAANLVWMAEQPLETSKSYWLKHGARTVKAWIETIDHRLNIDSLAKETTNVLTLNEIGLVRVTTTKPLAYDEYEENRPLGGFILIDPTTNLTVAAGMIVHGPVHTATLAELTNTNVVDSPVPVRLPQESRLRAVAKTASYRVFGSSVTAALTYVMSGSVSTAVTIGSFEVVGKLVLYYFHERLWNVVPFGRRQTIA